LNTCVDTYAIGGGDSKGFQVEYIAQAGVISTATVMIASNNSDEPLYTFNIQGGESSEKIPPRIENLRAFISTDTAKTPLTLFKNEGSIRFAFELVDSDSSTSSYDYAWTSAHDDLKTLLEGISQDLSDGTVTSSTIDISNLAAGTYPMTVTVGDTTFSATYKTELEFLLEMTDATITASDYADSDGDGIRDSWDKKPNLANSVSTRLDNSAVATDKANTIADQYVSKVPVGYRVVLGSTAKAAQKLGLKIAESDLQQFGNQGSNATGTSLSNKTLDHTFDYAIEGVTVPDDTTNPDNGNSIAIVMPLESPLTAESTFHKYNANKSPQWSTFNSDDKNTVEWADATSVGICPDPDESVNTSDGNYRNDTDKAGKTCLQITLQDGGDNDQDGAINGVIVDPFGIATPTPSTGGGSSSGGSSSGGSSSGSTVTTSCLIEGTPHHASHITENPQECSGGGYKTHYFLLELGEALTVDASVSYTTLDGTAIAGEDYVAVSGTAAIPAGANYAAVPVQLIRDNVAEPDETFSLVIRDPVGGVFPVGMTEIIATHVIRDDDRSGSAYLEAQPSQSHHVIKRPLEGDQNYTHYFLLELNQAPIEAISLSYHTESGTAIADQDFIAAAGTITIPAGQTHALIGVTLIGDQSDEDDETFSVVVTDPKGGNFPDGVTELRATHTIVDDD
jgi:hypothetical protein